MVFKKTFNIKKNIFLLYSIKNTLKTFMAKSRFEYVKEFEIQDRILPNTFIVIRIDGKGFHRFSDIHKFQKPNDEKALDLMTDCASRVMKDFNEIVLSYGQSDEYSFVFRKNTNCYNRRQAKLLTNVVSLFTSNYVFKWKNFMDVELVYPPSFDGRIIIYPSNDNLKDYISWRQADCHINNLYNTCFWKLVLEGNLTPSEAESKLRGTVSSDKNEMLFSTFGINYNDIDDKFKKGTTLIKEGGKDIDIVYSDVIRKTFWEKYPFIFN